ncbi:hypothetical protein C8Q80DRAFT_174616 [Daedaleopsis nitida]|nr:hypothetical protein C8Q80DRAFT_174616 [Daedaleopsis nitida]
MLCTWDPCLVESVPVSELIRSIRVHVLRLLQGNIDEEHFNGYRGIMHLYRQCEASWPVTELELGLPHMTDEDSIDWALEQSSATLNTLVLHPYATTWYQTLAQENHPDISDLMERWRMPSLSRCQDLDALCLSFKAGPIPEELPETLLSAYDYTLGTFIEIILSAPSHLSRVAFTFRHCGSRESASAHITDAFPRLSNWERLDDALTRMQTLGEVMFIVIIDVDSFGTHSEEIARRGCWRYVNTSPRDAQTRKSEWALFFKQKLPRAAAICHFTIYYVQE